MRHRVAFYEIDVRAGSRSGAGEPDHLRGQINGDDAPGTPGEQARKLPGAAADLQSAPAPLGNPAEQETVIMRVVIPFIIRQQSDSF
jgi:hypothetical protein